MIEPIARVRIELQEIEPTLWRRVDVPLTCTLLALHHIIRVTVGWTDSHLFEFVVGDRVYSEPLPDDEFSERKVYNAAGIRLRTLIDRRVERLLYVYDNRQQLRTPSASADSPALAGPRSRLSPREAVIPDTSDPCGPVRGIGRPACGQPRANARLPQGFFPDHRHSPPPVVCAFRKHIDSARAQVRAHARAIGTCSVATRSETAVTVLPSRDGLGVFASVPGAKTPRRAEMVDGRRAQRFVGRAHRSQHRARRWKRVGAATVWVNSRPAYAGFHSIPLLLTMIVGKSRRQYSPARHTRGSTHPIQGRIHDFVREVLPAVPRPLTKRVTCHVFWLIERRHDWHQRYDQFANETTGSTGTVNQLIGKAVKAVLGAGDLGETDAPECCALITRYMTLRVPPDT